MLVDAVALLVKTHASEKQLALSPEQSKVDSGSGPQKPREFRQESSLVLIAPQ